MYGWYENPTKIDVNNYLGGDDPVGQFEVGGYIVNVHGLTPENTPKITYHRARNRSSSDPRKTFPNMEVEDGVLKLPVEDIVGEMMSRLDPADLAKALWSENAEVREAFMECMKEHYESGISDSERRAFLVSIKEDIHDRRADTLQTAFAESEYAFSRLNYYWDKIQDANRQIERAEGMVRHAIGQPIEPTPDQTEVFKLPRIRDENVDERVKLFGPAWNEARNHWREKVEAMFPGPKCA